MSDENVSAFVPDENRISEIRDRLKKAWHHPLYLMSSDLDYLNKYALYLEREQERLCQRLDGMPWM